MRAVTIACWAITAVVLVGVSIWVLTSGVFFWRASFLGVSVTRPLGVASSQSVSAHDVQVMNIDWTAGRVTVMPWDGSEIQITEFSASELREGEALRLSTQDGTVNIAFRENKGPVIGIGRDQQKDLEVLIPRRLASDFESFSVSGVSGRVTVNGLSARTFAAGSVSGRLELTDITADRLNAETTSGRMEFFNISADDMILRSISGRMELFGTHARNLSARTTSGRMELGGTFSEHLNLESVSGRVEITSTALPTNLRANTVSGRIAVTVPNEGEVSIRHSSASGRFSSEIPTTHGADTQFDLSTTSGRVEIFALR